MIRLTAKGEPAKRRMARLAEALTPENLDHVVELAAHKTHASLVLASPKKWFGQIRSGWTMTKPHAGMRELDIPQQLTTANGVPIRQIAIWVDQGTANKGTGWIYPVRAKALYIPLTKKAAIGWSPELIRGKDYVLRTRVRGIKPRYFVAPQRKKGQELLRAGLKTYVERVLNRRGGG